MKKPKRMKPLKRGRLTRQTFAIVALLAVGCSSRRHLQATKDDMSSYKQDRYQCVQETRVNYSGSGVTLAVMQSKAQKEANRLYRLCMEARGYTVVEVSGDPDPERVPAER